MATHEFQEAFKNYRDLLFLDRNLQQWQESLGVLRDMLANRRQAFAERLPQVREKELALNLAGVDERYQALRAELERVERDADAAAFATPRERELQARLDRVRETLERAGSDPELAQARERYRRAAGALLWQQSDQFAVRLWSAKKGMQELQRNLSEAQQRDAALAIAERDEPARLDAFAGRIDALAARVDADGSARDRVGTRAGKCGAGAGGGGAAAAEGAPGRVRYAGALCGRADLRPRQYGEGGRPCGHAVASSSSASPSRCSRRAPVRSGGRRPNRRR